MPKGIFKRTEKHKLASRLNGKNRCGKEPINAKVKMNAIFDDYIVINRLTLPGQSKFSIWQCKCLKCGEINELNNKQLLNGYKTLCRKNYRPYNWDGYELLSGSLWTRIKNQAIARHFDFNINIKDAWDLYEKQNRKCALSGLEITFGNTKSGNTASLDRIDSTKGYTIDNIQWLHKDINMMKRNFTESYLFSLCDAILKNKNLISKPN